MDIIKLDANLRSQSGKTSARRLRRDGRIPAIAYGKELPSVALALTPRGLTDILKSAHGQNTVVELTVEKKKLTVLLREYTVHPVTRLGCLSQTSMAGGQFSQPSCPDLSLHHRFARLHASVPGATPRRDTGANRFHCRLTRLRRLSGARYSSRRTLAQADKAGLTRPEIVEENCVTEIGYGHTENTFNPCCQSRPRKSSIATQNRFVSCSKRAAVCGDTT